MGEKFNNQNLTVSDATEIAKSLQTSIDKITNTIQGVDKRMKHNLKVFGDLMNDLQQQNSEKKSSVLTDLRIASVEN